MLNAVARAIMTRVFTPVAVFLLRLGLGPDAVTIIGTAGVSLGALVLYPLGQLFWGTVVITIFVFADMLDGIMARLIDRHSRWGAFLDSTLDRIADSAVFLGIAVWFFVSAGHINGPTLATATALLSLLCLIAGSLVSYVRAKAEALGVHAAGGIAERADRLLLTLVATGLVGLGLPVMVLTVTLSVLVVLCTVTIGQRILTVRAALRSEES